MDNLKIKEITSSAKLVPPQGFEIFQVIIDIDEQFTELTFVKYKEIKHLIFEKLNTYCYWSIELIKVQYLSLHLEWHVTTQVVPHMIKIAQEQQEFFKSKYCSFMQIGEKVIFDVHAKLKSVSFMYVLVCIVS